MLVRAFLQNARGTAASHTERGFCDSVLHMSLKPNRLQIALVLAAAAATYVFAQQGQPPSRPADVPTVPPRGPVTVSADAVKEILAGIKAPAGFDVKVFAAPPIVNYPACITATLTGELFVCVDRNSSLQADPGMGSVLRLVDREQRRAGRRVHRVCDDGQPARSGVRRRHAVCHASAEPHGVPRHRQRRHRRRVACARARARLRPRFPRRRSHRQRRRDGRSTAGSISRSATTGW